MSIAFGQNLLKAYHARITPFNELRDDDDIENFNKLLKYLINIYHSQMLEDSLKTKVLAVERIESS